MTAGCLGTSKEAESGKTSKKEGAKIFYLFIYLLQARQKSLLKLALLGLSVKVTEKMAVT